MTDRISIPTPDPMPLPGPVWLLMTLLLVTFLLHLIAMNLTVGGVIISVICSRRRAKDEFAGKLLADLLKILPMSLAFTITLGVAALLFVQVLYGNLFYTSSILIGVFWIAVIPAVIVAYYGLYYSKSHPQRSGPLWLALVLLLAIGLIYVNNLTLMMNPQRWLSLYRSSPGGLSLNLSDRTVVPRYLHFMLGAFAVAGLAVFAAGVWTRATAYGQWLLQRGAHWFVAPTVLNIAVGMWFLLALPRNVLVELFTSGPWAGILLALGMLFPVAALAHVLLAARTEKTLLHARLAVVNTLLTLIVMVLLRQVVRNVYLAPYLRISELPVSPQWSVIALFLVLFVAGLATLYVMVRKVWLGSNVPSR